MIRWIKWILAGVLVYGLAINRFGCSGTGGYPEVFHVVAHRGVHHTFDAEGLDPLRGCTASRIHPPTHDYLENTIRSIEEAFRLGATLVEIDIRRSRDGHIVVFHDDYLECRTDGEGQVSDWDLEDLQGLDIGYGYTADGGKTQPFRGQGVGGIRTLVEVLAAFPDRAFLIDFKNGRNRSVADSLGEVLAGLAPERQKRIFLYSQPVVYERVHALAPGVGRFIHRSEMKRCGVDYLLYGWTGAFPESCKNRTLGVPVDYAWVLWGYPGVFLNRVRENGSVLYLAGVDTEAAYRKAVEDGVDGVITDRIEVISPLILGQSRVPGASPDG